MINFIKKSICVLFVMIFATYFFLPATIINISHAYSENKYLRVITDDTPFFKSVTDISPLMYLPYTYYVKVIGDAEGFFHVECFSADGYPGLDGYVPKDMLFADDLKVENPYLNKTIITTDTAILYKDNAMTEIIQYVFSDRELFYYGSLPTPYGNVFLVAYNGNLGYVKESAVLPFKIENHPNELTFIKPEVPPETDTDKKNETNDTDNTFSIRIIIILCLIFAGLIALFVVTNKKSKKNTNHSYYDENDYE